MIIYIGNTVSRVGRPNNTVKPNAARKKVWSGRAMGFYISLPCVQYEYDYVRIPIPIPPPVYERQSEYECDR